VLRLKPGSHSELFPTLRRLTLCGIPLRNGAEDISFAFRLTHLKFLKLKDCFGTDQMLIWLANSPQKMHLTSFELDFTWPYFGSQISLSKFLQSFQGLEDLFVLYHESWIFKPEYWSSVFDHHTTLRRVVHQQADTELDSFKRYINDNLIKIVEELGGIQYLGLCSRSDTLVSIRLSRTCLSWSVF
jgi:hypothetical protein